MSFINSVEKIEQLLQEIYDQSVKQYNEIQNEMNKLSNSCNLADVTIEEKTKYSKAIQHTSSNSVGDCSMEEAADEVRKASRRYAKRQITWFSAKPYVSWITCDTLADGIPIVKNFEDIVNNAKTLFK